MVGETHLQKVCGRAEAGKVWRAGRALARALQVWCYLTICITRHARIGKPWPAFVGLVLTPCHPATWPRHIRRDMCWPTLQLSAESLTPAPLRAHRRLRQNSEVQCLFTKHLTLSSRRHSTLRACSSPPTYHHVRPPLLTSCPTQPALRIFLC